MSISPSLIWTGFGLTDIGRVRKMNQDTFSIRDDLQLWVLADGMGGQAGGEIASQMAVDTITQYFETPPPSSNTNNSLQCQDEQHLLQALEFANQAIREKAEQNDAIRGMGTTVIAIRIINGPSGNQAIVAHAGDSRLYLLRENRFTLWTRDHTLMEERLALKLITPDQVRTHPLRHVLTKGLGIEPIVQPTITKYPLEPQDLLLLCSDGLTKMLTDQEIQAAMLKIGIPSQRLCESLITNANRLGGEDNTTVIVIGKERNRTEKTLHSSA